VDVRGLARLPEGAAVLVDTAPIVYLLDGHPLARRFTPLFEGGEAGRYLLMVTPITVAEVVTGPLRAGREAQALQYRAALCSGGAWSLLPIDDETAFAAARLRVRYRLQLPDALQLAAAVRHGCHGLVTHDRDFRHVSDLPIFGLD
jgi:predicted nucleic acid-binding protein